MHLLGPITLGITILTWLAIVVIYKQRSTGSVLDKPDGPFLVQLVNVFNLFFLLIVNPLVAIVLLADALPGIDPTHVTVSSSSLLVVLEICGWILYVGGFWLMAAALETLGRNYQLGGSAPRPQDKLVTDGPYRSVRHPMYAATLASALGLALLIQSLAILVVFVIYVVLIIPLVRLEERNLKAAYGDQYAAYQRRSKSVVPLIW